MMLRTYFYLLVVVWIKTVHFVQYIDLELGGFTIFVYVLDDLKSYCFRPLWPVTAHRSENLYAHTTVQLLDVYIIQLHNNMQSFYFTT